jgi:prepilin-type N-terminal cleavage/methylation domain-containing protein
MANQNGFSLIEVIVSIAIVSVVGVGLLSGLMTASKARITTAERETAKNIAEMQLEYVKSQPYNTTYIPSDIRGTYPGYSVIIETGSIASRDSDIQKITTTICYDSKPVLIEVGYKVR